MTMRKVFALLATLVLTAACGGATGPGAAPTAAAAATATAIPSPDYKDGDTLTVIVPYAAGGGFDVGARLLQPFLQTAMKKVTGKDVTVIVQNVEGANGQLGVEQIWRATPDGKRVMYTTQADMGGFQLRGSPIDVTKFTPIAQIANTTTGYIVRPGVIPANGTLKDLIERSKTKPILFGYTSPDSAKISLALLRDAVGFRVDTVSFGGTGDAVASLVRNEIEVYTVSLVTAVQQVQAHPTWRVLVQTGAKRDPVAQNVQTLLEAGIPTATADQINVITSGARTVHGPPGISPANTKALQEAFKMAITDPEFGKAFQGKGQTVEYTDGPTVLKTSAASLELFTKYKDIILAK